MRLPKLSLALLALLLATLPLQHWLLERQTQASLSMAIADTTQAANATVTRIFVNEIYPRLAPHLGLEGDEGTTGQPIAGAVLAEVDRTVRNMMLHTDIMKVKLYALNGMTVYSTEHAQIGQDQSQNPSFQSASQGIAGSQITHRGKFSAIEGEVFEKDLVASYIPIRNKGGLIIGVAEIYTDRTRVVESMLGGEGDLHPILLVTQAGQIVLILLLAWGLWTRNPEPEDDDDER